MSLITKLKHKPRSFQRLTGLTPEGFDYLLKKTEALWTEQARKKEKSGRPYKIGGLQEHLLCLLLYYRVHSPYILWAMIFRADEATIYRSVRRIEPLVHKVFTLQKRRALSSEEALTLIIDATEQPIQRPSKDQKLYYSGKKKRHTMKFQTTVDEATGTILEVSEPVPGSVHDFALYKRTCTLPPTSLVLADSGYQGLHKHHPNSHIPIKKFRGKPHPKEAQAHNRALAKRRIKVEHAFRRMKIYRIVKETYRASRATYKAKIDIISGLANMNLMA